MRKLIAAAALVSAVLPAIASAQEVYPEVRVSYRDLDLRQAEGVKRLDSRLRHAVKAVCPADVSADGWTQRAARRCRQATQVVVAASREAVLGQVLRTGTQIAAR
jgi:UrcA family protein